MAVPSCVLRRAGSDATAFVLYCPGGNICVARFLDYLGNHLVHNGVVTRFAITAEKVDDGYNWWFTVCCREPRPLSNIRRSFRTCLEKDHRAPKRYEVFTLTPTIQRRLGWGDARTDDAFVSALVNELHTLKWHPTHGSYAVNDEFTQARSDLAAEELMLRVPGLDLLAVSSRAMLSRPNTARRLRIPANQTRRCAQFVGHFQLR